MQMIRIRQIGVPASTQTIALFFASADILMRISVGFFCVLLIFVTLEMARHAVKTPSFPITILVGVIALLVSMTVAFVVGIIAAYVMARIKPT